MKNRLQILSAAIIALLFTVSCESKEDGPETSFTQFSFSPTRMELVCGRSAQPGVRYMINGAAKEYDFKANPLGLSFSSSDESTVAVDGECMLKALKEGEAVITAQGGSVKSSLTVTVLPEQYQMPDIKAAFSPDMVYGQYAIRSTASGNVNPQTFDIDDSGNVWAEGAKKPYVYVQRYSKAGKVNPSTMTLEGCVGDEPMQIFYAGHGSCLCIDPGTDRNNQYFWFANFGTKQTDGSYLQPRVLSRTKYIPGKRLLPQEADEHFYFGEDFVQMLPSIDFETRTLAIWVSSKKLIAMYDLDEVLAVPVSDVTISGITWGGESEAVSQYVKEGPVSVTIKAHDCRNLKPLARFTIGVTKGTQGYCIYGPDHKSYHLAGTVTPMNNVISVFDETGKTLMLNEEFGFDDDVARLVAAGVTTKDYLEAEGVRIKNRVMYVCMASTINGVRVTTILQFK